MSTFLVVFLSVYSVMHALVFARIRVLLPNRWPVQILCALFFVGMILAPIFVRLLENSGHDPQARLVAWVGYPWMGFIFLSFSAFLVLGLYDLLGALMGLAKLRLPSSSGTLPTAMVLVVVVLVCLYGYIDAKRIRTEKVSIKTSKLPAGVDRLRIVQISDVHLGLLVGSERLRAILSRVRAESPDILVSTGDLVDGNMNKERLAGISELFNEIPARYGKYGVTGNHEYIAGLAQSLDVTRQFGFKVLREEMVEVGDVLTIVGVDDPMGSSATDETTLLSSAGNGRFILLLKHRPEVNEKSLGLFDLQLSGHTHRGQIFPLNFVTARFYPMQDGYYEQEKGSILYTSRGSGTWGPPMRVLSPPEVTLIELVRDTDPNGP